MMNPNIMKKSINNRWSKAILMTMLLMAVLMTTTIGSFAEDRTDPSAKEKDFKVIGYYCGEWFDVPVEKLQAEKLTHLIYGFLIPLETGELKPLLEQEELKQLIEKCHSTGTKVYISVGGYSEKNGPPLVHTFEKIGADENRRAFFVDNVIEVVQQYGFDGVEVDWEYPNSASSADYEKTMRLLSEKLRPLGKGLSVALPGTGSTDGSNVFEGLSSITDKTLSSLDFINLMCYDLSTGPNHSPIWFTQTSLNYWKNFRNVPVEKLIVGMPLYARPSWQQYRYLIDMDKENAYRDYAKTEPLESTYNGLNTLREKTMIAYREAGGVMLFDVNEDTYDETSVLSMIDDTLNSLNGLSQEDVNNYLWIVVDNKTINYNSADGLGVPLIYKNRTLVPGRKLLESIGAQVNFVIGQDRQVTSVNATGNGIQVNFIIGSNNYTVNGKTFTMDSEAIIRNNRTYIPLRPVMEAFGYTLTYSEAGKSVYAFSN